MVLKAKRPEQRTPMNTNCNAVFLHREKKTEYFSSGYGKEKRPCDQIVTRREQQSFNAPGWKREKQTNQGRFQKTRGYENPSVRIITSLLSLGDFIIYHVLLRFFTIYHTLLGYLLFTTY
jgi:hypothetical protein